MNILKPMLATNAEGALRFPLYASPKVDGVRALVLGGKLISRSMKAIPNRHVSALLSKPELSGLDGELIVGSPFAKDVFRVTSSATAREDGQPPVTFYVFDNFAGNLGVPFFERLRSLQERFITADPSDTVNPLIVALEHRLISNEAQLNAYEQEVLALGYEGLILRSVEGLYKQGRSTAAQGWMLKLKRFTDAEAQVIGMEEEVSESGAPKGVMGALIVRDVVTGIVFNIGTGFVRIDREEFWKHREHIIAKGFIVKYKSFLIGVKDKPRFPVYLGVRNSWDMSK